MHVKVVTSIPEGSISKAARAITHMVASGLNYLIPSFFLGEIWDDEDFAGVRDYVEIGRRWDGRSEAPYWGGNTAFATFEGDSVRFEGVRMDLREPPTEVSLAAFEKLLVLWERGLRTKETVEADIPELDPPESASPITGE